MDWQSTCPCRKSTQPDGHVLPVVVDAMLGFGMDLSNAKPQKLIAELAQNAEMLVTIGCGDECPYVLALKCDDWPLPDPMRTRDRIGKAKPETGSSGVFCSCSPRSS
jgi:hypothetical protein